MNIKAKLYLLSVILALVTVGLTSITHNGLLQCIPYCILYLTVLYCLDDIRPRAFLDLFSFCYLSYFIFEVVAIIGISFILNDRAFRFTSFVSVILFNVLLALILSVTQIPFINKAIRANKNK